MGPPGHGTSVTVVECVTDNRVIRDSNPVAEQLRNFDNSVKPTLPVAFCLFLTFRHHLSLCGVAGLAETFPSFPVSGPFLPDVSGFQVRNCIRSISPTSRHTAITT